MTVGASGVVFGYATYLISRGLFNRRIAEVAFGVVVLLLFGAGLLSDLIPRSGISWEAHLFGGIGGVLAAAGRSPGPPADRRGKPARNPARARVERRAMNLWGRVFAAGYDRAMAGAEQAVLPSTASG